MSVYHVLVEQSGKFLSGRALERTNVFSQAKTLDGLIANIREVAALL